MKEVILFHFEGCPYCAQALRWIDELRREYPEIAALPIRMIDEKKQPDIADRYDYYYVPTLFVGGEKAHEGAATKQKIESALRKALA